MADKTPPEDAPPGTPEAKGKWGTKWKTFKDKISPDHPKESGRALGHILAQDLEEPRRFSFTEGQVESETVSTITTRPSTSDSQSKQGLVGRTKSRLSNMNRSSSNASNSSKKSSREVDSKKPVWGGLAPRKGARPLSLVQEEQSRQTPDVPTAVEEKDEEKVQGSLQTRSHMKINPSPNDLNPPLRNQHLGDWEVRGMGDYLPGQVVWAYHNTQNKDQVAIGDLRRYTRTNLHKNWVFTKERPFIILVRYRRQMLCLPLRSFDGAGLEKHRNNQAILSGYVAIKPAESLLSVFEGVNGRALEVSGGDSTSGSCVSLNEAVILSYDEEISVSGGHRLTPESTIRLLAIWRTKLQQAMDVDAQDINVKYGVQKGLQTAMQEFARR